MSDDPGTTRPDLGTSDDESVAALRSHLAKLERLIDPRTGARAVGSLAGPAWQRVTEGESRLAVTIAIVTAIGLMVALPSRVANHPRWLFPGLAFLVLVGLVVANPRRIDRQSRMLRVTGLVLIGILSVANAASAARLVADLVRGEGLRQPATLLLTGSAIWLTNVIVFGLWYWEFDRGGPVVRAQGVRPYPDFMFPQMSSPELAPPDWEANFLDYLYLSFTNAMAFSPTDVMPLSRWAKVTMLVQSVISLVTVALVIARAVNILR